MTRRYFPDSIYPATCRACLRSIPLNQPREYDNESREIWCMECINSLASTERGNIVIRQGASKPVAVPSFVTADTLVSPSSSTGGIGGYCETVVEAYVKVGDLLQGKAKVLPTADVIASLAATATIQYFRAGGK